MSKTYFLPEAVQTEHTVLVDIVKWEPIIHPQDFTKTWQELTDYIVSQFGIPRHMVTTKQRCYPAVLVELARAFAAGKDVGFALHDALLEHGCPLCAEHFVPCIRTGTKFNTVESACVAGEGTCCVINMLTGQTEDYPDSVYTKELLALLR